MSLLEIRNLSVDFATSSGAFRAVDAVDVTAIAFPVEPDFNLGDPRLLIGLLLLAVTALTDARRSSQGD